MHCIAHVYIEEPLDISYRKDVAENQSFVQIALLIKDSEKKDSENWK